MKTVKFVVHFYIYTNSNTWTLGFSTESQNVLKFIPTIQRAYCILITCIIARSNPRRLFSFCASGNQSHNESAMTSHNDPRTWCHELQVRFLLKRQTSMRTAPRTHAFIILRDDRLLDLGIFLRECSSVQNNHLQIHTMTSKKMVPSYFCLNNGYRLIYGPYC